MEAPQSGVRELLTAFWRAMAPVTEVASDEVESAKTLFTNVQNTSPFFTAQEIKVRNLIRMNDLQVNWC